MKHAKEHLRGDADHSEQKCKTDDQIADILQDKTQYSQTTRSPRRIVERIITTDERWSRKKVQILPIHSLYLSGFEFPAKTKPYKYSIN